MSRKAYTVPFGGRLRIEIESTEDSQKAKAGREEAVGESYQLLPGAERQRRYLPSEEIRFILLDVGTRLRSVREVLEVADYSRARPLEATDNPEVLPTGEGYNEYVEINLTGALEEFDSIDPDNNANSGSRGFNALLPAALFGLFDNALMGSLREGSPDTLNPLGTSLANNSGREVPNCMLLPYRLYAAEGSGSILLDVILTPIGEEGEAVTLPASEVDRESVRLIGNPPGYPFPKLDAGRWKKREAVAGEDLEKWNIVNREGGDGPGLSEGYLDVSDVTPGQYHLEIDSRLYYERFNTANREEFKVTELSDFNAEEVAFSLSIAPARIFLKPQYLALLPYRQYSTNAAFFRYETKYFSFHPGIGFRYGPLTPLVSIHGLLLFGSPVYNPDTEWNEALTVEAVRPSGSTDATLTPGGVVVHGTEPFPGLVMISAAIPNLVPGLDVLVSCYHPDILDESRASQVFATMWNPNQVGAIFYSASIYAPIAGRLPIYGRLLNSGWDTLYYLNYRPGRLPTYEYAAAGLQLGFNSGFGATLRGEMIFKKRPGWNTTEIIKEHSARSTVTPLSFPVNGQQCVLVWGFNSPPCFQPFPFGGATALALPELQRRAEAMKACIVGMEWHREASGIFGGDAGDYTGDYDRSVDLVPSRIVPPGILCGIVEQGGRVFFIWRKVPQDNFKPDYQREQATGVI